MTDFETIDLASRASDFATLLKGKIPPDLVAGASDAIKTSADQTGYSAALRMGGGPMNPALTCTIDGGKTFTGGGWGIAWPGVSVLDGYVYLAAGVELDSLYANTSNFTMTTTPVYTALYFLDNAGTLLGHFQAGAAVTIAGAAGGAGSWS